jgi:hypothetical protein
MRRDGTLTPELENQLGNMYYNIARWGIATMVRKGKLIRPTAEDEDFFGEMLIAAIKASDRANLDMDPPAILVYVRNSVINAAKVYLRDKSRLKRQGTLVELSEINLTSDVFGNTLK